LIDFFACQRQSWILQPFHTILAALICEKSLSVKKYLINCRPNFFKLDKNAVKISVLIPSSFLALSRNKYAAANPVPFIWPITAYNSNFNALVLSNLN